MIVVIGLGRETRGLLGALERERPGAEVLLVDERDPGPVPDHPGLALRVARVDLDRPDALPPSATTLYRSPGVSPYRPALATARARGARITTPTGWWASRRDGADVIAVTGTKGKSTTASMTAHLLRAAGRRVALLGNIGHAALDEPGLERGHDVVLELSSYQLVDFEAPVALAGITSLHRDHVPWHGSLARYQQDKLRLLDLSQWTIVTRQVAEHPAVVGHRSAPSAVTAPPLRTAVTAALRAAGMVGEHLVDDAVLALALTEARLGRAAGCRDLVGSLAEFRPLPHRLTLVAEHRGIRWVDDSISTIPESAVAAARAYRPEGTVTLLLGGDDRGQDLDPLVALLADDGVRAVVLPPLADRLVPALEAVAPRRVSRADDLPAAVALAARLTPGGGTVLLSPAAPSFHAYRDFVARGEHFVALVGELVRGE